MAKLQDHVDARTKLAGANKLEILLFGLGRDVHTGRKETFGINVFKVREVTRVPPITAVPTMPTAVQGMISRRGSLVRVIELAKFACVEVDGTPEVMMTTEYNNHSPGFFLESVDTILRLLKIAPSDFVERLE